jgi:biotin carboxyl carrier protein
MLYYARVNGEEKRIKIEKKDDGYAVLINDEPYDVDIRQIASPNTLSLIVKNKCYEATITNTDRNLLVCISGEKFEIDLEDELEHLSTSPSLHQTGAELEEVKAPMPGVVVSIEVEEGEELNVGSAIVIVEAMKMQNEISTVTPGKVKQVLVREGDIVDSRQTLVVIERS